MTKEEPDIEYSPLGGEVERNAEKVLVEIYRHIGSPKGWTLEVVGREDASMILSELFATDHEAYAEFLRMLEAGGIGCFLTEPNKRVH